MAADPRHDFYQTDSLVIVSVYIKGCKAEDVKCAITESSLALDVFSPSPVASLHIAPLFSSTNPDSSSFKVLGTKIEIKLQKADVGIHWKKLKGEEGGSAAPTIVATTSASTSSTTAPRHHSKWDSFKPEEEEEAGVDEFFKTLYAGADDDTRRAMMKSYQESGGTALSTNWSEVGKAKVETTPPDGMVAKKW